MLILEMIGNNINEILLIFETNFTKTLQMSFSLNSLLTNGYLYM